MDIEKGKLRLESNALVQCARCDMDGYVPRTTWSNAAKVLRSQGWSDLKGEGWICPRCARGHKLELKVQNKSFRGQFTKDGKQYIKTANGVFPLGEVKGD